MTLPSSRNTTYSPASQVKSADLNTIQDCIVGAKHGDLWLNIPPHDGIMMSGTTTLTAADIVSFTGAAQWMVPFAVPAGKRLKSMKVALNGNASQTMQVVLRGWTSVPSSSRVASSPTHTPAAGFAYYTTDFADITVAADEHWQFLFSASGSAIQLGTISLLIDHP